MQRCATANAGFPGALRFRGCGENVAGLLEAHLAPVALLRAGDGDVIYESPAARTLLRRDAARAESGRRSAYSMIAARLGGAGTVEGLALILEKADGSTFRASVSSRPFEHAGEPALLVSLADASGRGEAEPRAEQDVESLHRSEKLAAFGTLLAGVAHELNNPLSVVSAQAMLMKETVTDAALVRRATKIANAAERCSRIVRTFLAMARERPVNRTAVHVNEVVEIVVEFTRYLLRTSDIELVLRLDEDVPLVWGDPDELNQVVTNLVLNAQQALAGCARRRSLTIATVYDETLDHVLLSVSDNGPGIPKEIRSRMFEPFFTTKEVGMGTGIGLSVCQRIVESLQGEIGVSSQEGQGAAFTVALPPADRECRMERSAAESLPRVSRCKLLVIENEPDVANMLEEILAADGHSVRIAPTASRALHVLARHEFDLILTDLNIPDMDGFRLFDTLCELSPRLRHRIAFVTGDSFSAQASELLERSDRPCLEKPFSPDQVRGLLRELLSHVRLSELLHWT